MSQVVPYALKTSCEQRRGEPGRRLGSASIALAVGCAVLGLSIGMERAVCAASASQSKLPAAPRTAPTLVEEWRWNGDLSEVGVAGLEIADLDADGEPEIIHATNGDFDVHCFVWSCQAGGCRQEWASPRLEIEITAMAIVQVDADDALEVLLGSGSTIFVYDGASHVLEDSFDVADDSLEWSAFTAYGGSLGALEAADVDVDGDLELVAASWIAVNVFNAADGQREWSSTPSPEQRYPLLRVGDVDGDALLEVVTIVPDPYTAKLRVLDGRDGSEQLAVGDRDAWALDVSDLDGDGVAEIVIGTSDGRLQIVDPVSGDVVADHDLGTGAIDALHFVEVAGCEHLVAVVVAGNRLYLYDAVTLQPLLVTDPLAFDHVGEYDSVLVKDVDHDGVSEVVVNLGLGFVVFELYNPGFVFEDGFETGDTLAWTTTVPLV